jgi:hypothetical protein
MELSYKIDYWRAVNDECIWDELMSNWTEIIELAEEFVNCSMREDRSVWRSLGERQKQVIFDLDTGLIVPLYFVAGKCRDSRIRRKAIQLLRASERQEGVSNSLMTAKVAERLVEIEEEGLLDREGERGSEVGGKGEEGEWCGD